MSKTHMYCEYCQQTCSDKYVFKRHLLSIKHCENKQKASFYCSLCKYATTRKRDYDLHMETTKHRQIHSMFHCSVCSKQYKTRSGIWKHGQLCKPTTVEQATQDPNLLTHVVELMKQNKTLMEMIQKPTIHQTIHKQFNLNIFLNEECKDAMNWSEFIQNIQITLKDLDKQTNITDKVSHIICKELEHMGMYRRPLHCLDSKRKKTCIRENNEWKRESDILLTGGIRHLSNKFKNTLTEWAKLHPAWYNDQTMAEEYMEMVLVYMAEPDQDKCMSYLLKATPIKLE